MAKMIMIFNPKCADKVFIDNLQNCVPICQPPKFDVGRPTLVDLFNEWNKKFHEDEVNPRQYSLMFNFAGNNRSISEISHSGNVVKDYINDSLAGDQAFIHMMFSMLADIDEVNYLL